MPKKVHTEGEIIAALKQYESGEKTADICRKLGISQATFYLWNQSGTSRHFILRQPSAIALNQRETIGNEGSMARPRALWFRAQEPRLDQ